MQTKISELKIEEKVFVDRLVCEFLGLNKANKYLFRTCQTGSYFLKELNADDMIEKVNLKRT